MLPPDVDARRLIMLICESWLPQDKCSSQGCLAQGAEADPATLAEKRSRSITDSRVPWMAAAAPRSPSGLWCNWGCVTSFACAYRQGGLQAAAATSSGLMPPPARELHLAADGPDEPGQLTRHHHHDLGLHEPTRAQPLELVAQVRLGLPGDLRHALEQALQARRDAWADPGPLPVMSRHLDEHAPRGAVAGIGDRAPVALGAR
jgi:hypothetical protein